MLEREDGRAMRIDVLWHINEEQKMVEVDRHKQTNRQTDKPIDRQTHE